MYGWYLSLLLPTFKHIQTELQCLSILKPCSTNKWSSMLPQCFNTDKL